MGEQEKKPADKKPASFWRRSFPTFRYILYPPTEYILYLLTRRWFIYCICVFMILVCFDLTLAWWWRHIPVSYQTTRILGPLNPDGTVDYLAALNAKYSKGVTPDNNAVVDIWQAVGTKHFPYAILNESFPKSILQRYFQLLGVQIIPEPSKPFESFYNDYIQTNPSNNIYPDYDSIDKRVTSAPFTDEEFPNVAAWVKAQHAARELYLTAAEKSYWYEPLFISSEPSFPVISCLLPSINPLRMLTNLMQIDSMERLGRGDVSGAWADALAIHRMARLEMKTPVSFLGCAMIAISLEADAGSIDQQIVANGRLRADEVGDMLQDLQSLQEFLKYSELFNGERYTLLDFLQGTARGPQLSGEYGIIEVDEPTKLILDLIPIHYAVVMSDVNQYVDDVNKAFASDTYLQAKASLDALNPAAMVHGGLLHPLIKGWFVSFQPSYSPFLERYFESLAILPLTQTEFALAAWHADHGGYPAALAELVPQYLTRVPIDPFDGQPLRYEQTNGGYKLSSIGYTQTNPNPNIDFENLEFTLHRDLEFTMPPAQQN
ncbi:MAG TPA: hypothetical protein VMG59_10075 [Phycisphaerae bacterium]|nr:hypothetical protein [Phycisphaerae bacterium]